MVVVDKLSVTIETDVKQFNKGVKSAEQSLEGFDKKAKKTTETVKKQTKTLNGLNEKLRLLKSRLGKVEIGSKKFKELSSQIARTEMEIDKVTQKTSKMTGVMKAAGGALAAAFAVDKIVTFGKESILAFAKFEDGLARVNTVANVSDKQLERLGKGVQKLSAQYGIQNDQLLETAFNISSAGVEYENIIPLLDLSAKVAKGAATDTTTAFNGIIAVVKKYNLDLSEANSIAEKFFITNKLGQTTIGEVADGITQLSSAAEIAGISLNEVFAAYATFTGVTGNASEVTTQLNGAILALGAPTQEAAAAFNALGIEVGQNAIKQKGLAGVAKDVYDATGGNLSQLRKLIPEQEALKLITALATTQNQKYKDSIDELIEGHGNLENAVKGMSDTTASKIAVMSAKWENFKTNVGRELVTIGYFLYNLGVRIGAIGKIIGIFAAVGILTIGAFVREAADLIIGLAKTFGTLGILAGKSLAILGRVTYNALKELGQNFLVFGQNIPGYIAKGLNKLPGLMIRGIRAAISAIPGVGDYLADKLGLNDPNLLAIKFNFDESIQDYPGFKKTEKGIGELGDLVKGAGAEIKGNFKNMGTGVDFLKKAVNRADTDIGALYKTIKNGAGPQAEFEKLKIQAQRFGEEQKKVTEEQEKSKKTLKNLNNELAKYKAQLQTAEIGSKKFKELQGKIAATEAELKKYSDTSKKAGSSAKKDIEDTTKKLEQEAAKQKKEYEKLGEQGQKEYTKIKKEIAKQVDKLYNLRKEYDKYGDKIEEISEKGQKDIQKITDKIEELQDKLGKIQTEGKTDLVERELEIQERLKDIEEERYQLKKSYSEIEDSHDRKRNKEEQGNIDEEEIALKKELEVLNQNITEEERLKATTELQKTKTDKLLENIEAKTLETQNEIEKLEEEKTKKQEVLDAEILGLEQLQEAKKQELLAEYENYQTLITDKNKLDKAYLKAFEDRSIQEIKTVDKLIAKYRALAAAKAKARAGGIIDTIQSSVGASPTSNSSGDDKASINVNNYGTQNFNNDTDVKDYAEETAWKINP